MGLGNDVCGARSWAEILALLLLVGCPVKVSLILWASGLSSKDGDNCKGYLLGVGGNEMVDAKYQEHSWCWTDIVIIINRVNHNLML